MVEILIRSGGCISTPKKYLHQKTSKSTLRSAIVEVVEMVEVFSMYLGKHAVEVQGDELGRP
jgi:hypothetical protein